MSKSSIVLCGFMSCGKTTLGHLLSERLGYAFADTDSMLFESAGMTLQEMFAKGGEAYFRNLEHETVRRAAQLSRTVISTGGGVMTFERNALLLHEACWVIHIHRPFDACYAGIRQRENRPIAGQKSEAEMRALYDRRVPLYNKYADFTLENTGSAEEGLAQILGWMKQNTDLLR